MKDVQSERDKRGVYLNRVGIEDLRIPIKLQTPSSGPFCTVAELRLAVDLSAEERGTHMSRFIEIVNEIEILKPHKIEEVLEHLKERLGSEAAFLDMTFPYFIKKKAPVSNIESLIDIDCAINAELIGDDFSFLVKTSVPVTTLCPCSKEISDRGAHNQKAMVTITIKSSSLIWYELLVEIVERNASSPVYSLLKRPDEKYVTEAAYDNPKFVEDLTRDIYKELEGIKEIEKFEVYVKSFESIHNHNAFALALKQGD